MNTWIRKIKNYIYSLPFMMRGGEVLTAQSSGESDGNHHIEQQLQKNSLAEALMNAEVTQEVEELRYRDYTVAEASREYEYVGDGVAIRHKKKKLKGKIKFKQRNGIVVEGVLDELKRLGEYGIERYVLNIKYNDIPRFKIEKYCNYFEMDYDVEKKECFFLLKFDTLPDSYDFTSKGFLNELEKLTQYTDYLKHEFSAIDLIEFVTNNVEGENNLVKYSLSSLILTDVEKIGFEYVMTYHSQDCERINLVDKFYSKSMDEKYKTKEKKQVDLNLTEGRKRYCAECGAEISVYDGDITEKSLGRPLCQNCLKKYLNSK